MVYAVGDQKIGAYEYERWIGPPPELIRDVILRNLRASGRYQGVYTPQGKAGGDYLLRTRIYDFKEQDSGSSLTGRLTMDVELQNTRPAIPCGRPTTTTMNQSAQRPYPMWSRR